MQKRQQFSARKQYFNGNDPLPSFIEKQVSADQSEQRIGGVSVEVKTVQKSLKNQSMKSGAKSQSSLNEEDRGKSLTTQFMNMFAFGGQQKRGGKKDLEVRKSQDAGKKSKNSSKNMKSSFLGSHKDDQAKKMASGA